MTYTVTVEKTCAVKQGLGSPVRHVANLPPLKARISLTVRAGVTFGENQLTGRGWFIDTDELELQVQNICQHLASDTWTSLFDFRPTFELVARQIFDDLSKNIPQLLYIELHDQTMGSITRYSKEGI